MATMITLTISGFSCLRDATLTLAPVNILIGPQGSGKSVTTKLLYYFTEMQQAHIQSCERGDSIDDYQRSLSRQFSVWFPPSAWGPDRFNINYSAGPFTARVLRRTSRGNPSSEVSVTFSDWFRDFYKNTFELFHKPNLSDIPGIETNLQASAFLDRSARLREIVVKRLTKELGSDHIAQQTFIPAGRSFFTSIGRLVAGFEQAGSLDPVTLKFARLFAAIRERNNALRGLKRSGRSAQSDFETRRTSLMLQFFGGELKYDDDVEYVETSDGRKVPFAYLSSGQQELLPMWSIVDYYNEGEFRQYARETSSKTKEPRSRSILYIEEPEAHLFPSAQAQLLEFLLGSVASGSNGRTLFITTHSPYIMSLINVFLKAGKLSRNRKRIHDLIDIVPRECWLNTTDISALALEDRQLHNLMDEDGLIDARYLDNISEDISRRFSKLLKIEDEL